MFTNDYVLVNRYGQNMQVTKGNQCVVFVMESISRVKCAFVYSKKQRAISFTLGSSASL